jgi:type VI secretion system protein ImpA
MAYVLVTDPPLRTSAQAAWRHRMQMNDTTIASLAAPLAADAPSGDSLEYDAQFLTLEQALDGTPEAEYNGLVTPAVPPDWPLVQTLALALMERTRDLRVAMALTRAALALRGVAGLADGLALLDGLLAGQWETVHPQLEAEDDFDPMLRVNVLAGLVAPAQLLRELRAAPLVQVRAIGSFSLRDIEQARTARRELADGADPAAAGAGSLIGAAFAAAAPAALDAVTAALEAARQSVAAIELHLAEHVGVGKLLDLAPLSALIGQALAALHEYAPATAADATAAAGGDESMLAPAGAGPARAAAGDVVAGRADVVRLLDRICAYYDQHEPASPIPLLLQRARRMVDMRFADLLQDLAPDGLQQLSRASGIQHES